MYIYIIPVTFSRRILVLDGPGNHRLPPVGRRWTREGWARETASSGRVSGAVAHLSKSRRAARRRDVIADRMLGMGDHRRGGMMAVSTFDVCSNAAVNSDLVSCTDCIGRLKQPFFALPGRLSVVTMVISSRRQKHLFPLPLPLRYATVLCFAASASMRLECGPRPP